MPHPDLHGTRDAVLTRPADRDSAPRCRWARKPVYWYTCHVKVTIDLDSDLYRAVKVEAARAGRSVREIVDEALAGWLDRLEHAEDVAAAAEALAEYERDGGVAADEFFTAHAAETRAAYRAPGQADSPDPASTSGDESSTGEPAGRG